jgi:hypothetical protein
VFTSGKFDGCDNEPSRDRLLYLSSGCWWSSVSRFHLITPSLATSGLTRSVGATEPSCGGTQSQRIAVEQFNWKDAGYSCEPPARPPFESVFSSRGPSGASASLPFFVSCASSVIQDCSVKEPTSIESNRAVLPVLCFSGSLPFGGPRTQAAITSSPDWESTAFLQVPCLAPAFSAVDRRLFSFLLP